MLFLQPAARENQHRPRPPLFPVAQLSARSGGLGNPSPLAPAGHTHIQAGTCSGLHDNLSGQRQQPHKHPSSRPRPTPFVPSPPDPESTTFTGPPFPHPGTTRGPRPVTVTALPWHKATTLSIPLQLDIPNAHGYTCRVQVAARSLARRAVPIGPRAVFVCAPRQTSRLCSHRRINPPTRLDSTRARG